MISGPLKRRITRIVFAVLVAPLTIVPVALVFLTLSGFSSSSGSPTFFGWLHLFSLVGLVIAYPATIALGLPAYFLLLHFRKSSYLVFGVVGTLAALFIGLIASGLPPEPYELVFLAMYAMSGAAVALVFRGIAGTPDSIEP